MTDKQKLIEAFDELEFDDEEQECSWCNGCGEGDYDGAACRKCHGTGIEPSDKEDDDYE
jgi:DnaJ-class molecular chaperone